MPSRRDFLKKGVYVAPAIVTLHAVPAFAGTGSGRPSSRRGPPEFSRGPGRGRPEHPGRSGHPRGHGHPSEYE